MAVDIFDLLGAFSPSIPAMENRESERIRLRIRSLRRERGLTLLDFERASGGRIRAVVLGAYERGDRSMSLSKVIEIANVFNLELSYLIRTPELERSATTARSRHIYDLRLLRASEESPQKGILTRYISWITEQRGDWAGEVISLRQSDVDSLSIVIDRQGETFQEWIIKQGVMLTKR